MTETRPKIRVYVDAALSAGQELDLRAHANYLANVMRLSTGDQIAMFNGRDGEWACTLSVVGKRQVTAICQHVSSPQRMPPDLWLCFAPIKKARTDFIVEKAAELGAARLQPVFTQYTNSERLRVDRLQAHAIEAAEQCGGTFVPPVLEPVKLAHLLDQWPSGRGLVFCDESLEAQPIHNALQSQPEGPWGVLIGPEGGFSPQEAEAIRAHPATVPVTLGPRILRADTAAVAALTAWQIQLGDWS